MRFSSTFILAVAFSLSASGFGPEIESLIETSCLECHETGTDTRLNFETLSEDLDDRDAFEMWVKVLDRAKSDEMPPPAEDRPDTALLQAATNALQKQLRSHSLAAQTKRGRVPARRLTKLEYGYTIRDLLKIDADVTSHLPEESESGSFDTVGSSQRVSAIHMEGYLRAADEALDRAIRRGPNPYREFVFDLHGSAFLNDFHDKPLTLGGNITRKLDEGVAVFRDNDYLLQSTALGYRVPSPGLYKITTRVEAFQSKGVVPFKLIVKEPSGGATIVNTLDLMSGKPQTVDTTAFLNPGDAFYVTLESDDAANAGLYLVGAKKFKGQGLALRQWKVAGPLTDSWPPPSTKQLTADNDSQHDIQMAIAKTVRRLSTKVFRRGVPEVAIAGFVALADPAIAEGRDFESVLQVPLRAMLTSPQFLMFNEQPGKLDEFSLANRLSYFLWKSMPDDELTALATSGELSADDVIRSQVERMLDDPKSERFVQDFLGQWLHLYKINATSPDEKLYPEFDEILGHAIGREPEFFFAAMIRENLSLSNVIDSDFTFVNRRLAEHYGIKGVESEQFRRVTIPDSVHRGGMLTQAAVLKTIANGTVTSPVTRGSFVLANVLGTPPSPPPPSVGSIEPDTRGQTTIREILDAHRNTQSCNQCHRKIDPPGFALESYDPVGGYRTKYRATGPGEGFFAKIGNATFHDGLPVDASGVTADGEAFDGIDDFKRVLLDQQQQVARNFVSKLIVYATGGEIEFADREAVAAILKQTAENDFPVRDVIHAVVQSRLFQEK